MDRTTKRNAFIAGGVALAVLLGLGAWAVASRSTSTENIAGASSTGESSASVRLKRRTKSAAQAAPPTQGLIVARPAVSKCVSHKRSVSSFL